MRGGSKGSAICRLFGLTAGHERVRATFWLLDAPDGVVLQSRANPDGTGLGTFDRAGEALVEKAPLAAYADRAFASEARRRESTTFLAHVRHASTGARTVLNTHPFVMDNRIGAHNGVVEGLRALEEHLGEDLSRVHGDTDSERVLALVARETRAADGDVGAGLVAALGWVGEHLPLYAANLLVTTADDLWAVRYPATHELWMLRRDGRAEALDQTSGHGTRIRSEHLAAHPSVVVASERLDADPGWTMVDPDAVVHIGPDLQPRTVAVLPTPRHPLTLADLGHAAARSQQPGSG